VDIKGAKMDFGKAVLLYFATFGVFFVIDLIWLLVMNSRFYKVQLSELMAEKVKWIPAILFYLLFIVGVLLLVVLPAVDHGTWLSALLLGGLLGMISYGTYDLTNLASIRNWPLKVSIVDIIWGTVLSAVVSTASFFIALALTSD
jgi:uncharacterized membrane protein